MSTSFGKPKNANQQDQRFLMELRSCLFSLGKNSFYVSGVLLSIVCAILWSRATVSPEQGDANLGMNSTAVASWQLAAAKASEVPFRFKWCDRPSCELSSTDCQWIQTRKWPINHHRLTLSLLLHLLRLPSEAMSLTDPATGRPVLAIDVVLNEEVGRSMFGVAPMRVTDFGVRYPGVDVYGRNQSKWQSAESHRDQFLAIMGEIGTPLSTRISVGGKRKYLRDVLADSLAQFHLDQEELAWSAAAYAQYLPPTSNWSNRYGEVFSFDRLSDELLSGSLDKASCRGMHIAFALLMIYNVSDIHPIISDDVTVRIRRRIHEWISSIVSQQLPDGSWPAQWWKQGNSPEPDILATSHIVEWLFVLPVGEFEIPAYTTQKATHWLLQEAKAASDSTLEEESCPYSHTLYVLNRVAHSAKKE